MAVPWGNEGLIAFQSNRSGTSYDVFVMDPGGTNQRPVEANDPDGFDGEPTWVPNGVISAGLIEPGTSVDLFLSVDDPDTQVSGDEVPPYSFQEGVTIAVTFEGARDDPVEPSDVNPGSLTVPVPGGDRVIGGPGRDLLVRGGRQDVIRGVDLSRP